MQIVQHDEVARELGIDACATVSQAFMEAAMKWCFGVTDMGLLLRGWSGAVAQLPSVTDVQFLEDGYCAMAQARARDRAGWASKLADLALDLDHAHIIDILRRFRSVVEEVKPGASPSSFHPNEFFSDFSAVESWQIFYAFGRALELVRAGMPYQQIETRVWRYKITVDIVARPSAAAGKLMAEMALRGNPDLILSYILGQDLMFHASRPGLKLRTPSAAWRALRGLRCPPDTSIRVPAAG